MNERGDKLDGPYRVAEIITIWTRVARMVEHLWKLGIVSSSSAEVRKLLGRLDEAEQPDVDDPSLNLALAMLSAPDDMTASDWVRMKVVDARGRTNVSLHKLDLRGLQCRRLVIRCDEEHELYRVTIQNRRGDFASVESSTFSNALDGAIVMAGARKDLP